MKVAAIGDLHYRVNTKGLLQELLGGIEARADILVLAGDLTDTGLPDEMAVLLEDLRQTGLPVVAVLGNHDHESNQAEVLAQMMAGEDIYLLNGKSIKIDGIGFVGTKGFCGGFNELFVQPFGEQALKAFINVSIEEAIQLENALVKLNCEHVITVLHYAPIPETLAGEPKELYPFLGCSRLANAIDRHPVDVVFHGHAHHGSPHGKTSGNIPVYNVSRYVLREHTDHPYCLYEI